MTRGELERAAVEWAREVLEAAWSPSRFRLGPGRASRAVRFVAGRPRVRVEVDVWERVGSGEAALDGGGARFPGVHEPDGVGDAPRDPEEPALRAALESILEAARLAGKSEPLRVRACAVRSEGRALQRVIGCLEGRAADGRVEIDLDGRDGARVGYRCLPFLRGSRRCAALSRWSAVQRARAALDLPPGARLTRAALADRGEGRLWRLRWKVESDDRVGVVAAALNARTGRVCVLQQARRAVAETPGVGVSEADAVGTLALVVGLQVGEDARVGAPIRGLAGGEPVWLAAVRAGDGSLLRATVDGRGRVRLARLAPRAARWRGRGVHPAPPARAPQPS